MQKTLERRVSFPSQESRVSYEAPQLAIYSNDNVLTENDAVFVAAIGWVVLVFGGAWAYCKAMCGWNGVKSCSTSWLQVTAVCK